MLFVSGYADRTLVGGLGARAELLEKPFLRGELLARVAALIERGAREG